MSNPSSFGRSERIRSQTVSAPRALIGVAALGAALVYGCLVIASASPASANSWGPWVDHTVVLVGSPGPVHPACSTIYSRLYADRFCLSLVEAAAGDLLNGSFDHGPGTSATAIYLAQGPRCLSACPLGASWVSPDGTGMLTWNFTVNVTIAVLG